MEFEMAKNWIREIGTTEEAWDEFVDKAAVESKRAKIEKPKAHTEEWAKLNRVDDESVQLVFKGVNRDLLLSLSYDARLAWIMREVRLYKAEKQTA